MNSTNPPATSPLSKPQARRVTAALKRRMTDLEQRGDRLREAILAAHHNRVWEPLGYSGWADYVQAEFAEYSRRQTYRIIDWAGVTGELSGAAGQPVEISQRQAIAVKPEVVAMATEIREAVAAGTAPGAAVANALASQAARVSRATHAEPEPDGAAEPDPELPTPEPEPLAADDNPVARAVAAAEAAQEVDGDDDEPLPLLPPAPYPAAAPAPEGLRSALALADTRRAERVDAGLPAPASLGAAVALLVGTPPAQAAELTGAQLDALAQWVAKVRVARQPQPGRPAAPAKRASAPATATAATGKRCLGGSPHPPGARIGNICVRCGQAVR